MQELDGQRIEAAFLAHRAALVRRMTALTRDPEVAQDLAQEAFFRLAREVEAGRAPDDVPAWLHRVAANLATSRGRHLQVVERRADELPRPGETESPERIVVDAELAAEVHACIAELSQPEQRALALAAHGYRAPEIAGTLGRTPGATRTLLCRARAKIRERMLLRGFAPA